MSRGSSASSAEPQAASVTVTSPAAGKYCSVQLTNYDLWPAIAYPYFFKASSFYLISVLLTLLLLTTSQGKYIFSTKSILTAKDAFLNYFFTHSLFSSCSEWLQPDPFPLLTPSNSESDAEF